ncbi:hypothetical protein F5Y13DRAFT_200729 [Hypoxylon sp. FL1857]|nr:hypothetical protein F5Y13DRAFT_200729 [Hypoxylon sp. FL1857]
MWGKQATVRGIPPRRSACDRCKGQKLKCVREPGQDRCCRCTRAGVGCLTTPGFRFRHISGDGTGSGSGSGSRQRLRQEDQKQSDLVPSTSQNVETSLADVLTNTGNTHDPLYLPTGVTGSWELGARGFVFSDDIDGNLNSLDLKANKDNTPANNQSKTATAPTLHSKSSSEGASCQEGQGDDWYNVAPFFPANVILPQDHNSQVNGGISEDVHIQRLSRMNFKLATLLSHLSQGFPTVTIGTLVSPSNECSMTPIHNVADSTREFIDILRALSELNHQSMISSSSEGPFPRSQKSMPLGNTNISVAAGDRFPVYKPSQANPPTTATAADGRVSDLNATILLLITTSYIHISRLYLVFFAHFYEFIRKLSGSGEPSLYAIPEIGFNIPALESGNVQATLFIEIVNNLFQRMEDLLGIPSELRIGPRGTDNGGLLSEEGFAETLRMMVSREELLYLPEYGKGGARALRKYIKKTKQLWEEHKAR